MVIRSIKFQGESEIHVTETLGEVETTLPLLGFFPSVTEVDYFSKLSFTL